MAYIERFHMTLRRPYWCSKTGKTSDLLEYILHVLLSLVQVLGGLDQVLLSPT